MNMPTPSLIPFAWRLVCLTAALVVTAAAAQAGPLIPLVSTGGDVSIDIDGLCVGCSITGAANVVSDDLMEPAVIGVPLGVAGSASLSVGFPEVVGRGAKVGFRIGASGPLDLSVLGNISVTTYLDGRRRVGSATGAPIRILPYEDGTGLLLMNARNSFDEVEIKVEALVGVSVDIDVFYAIALPKVRTVVVREIPTASNGASASGGTVGGICVPVLSPCDVAAPQNVVSDDPDEYAVTNLPIGLGASAWVDVFLPEEQTDRPKAGFVIENGAGLLDLGVLNGITLTTYRDGVVQRSETGAGSLDIKDLGDGRTFVYLRARRPFDQIRITMTSLLSVAVQVRVYHAQLQYKERRATATGEAPETASEASATASAPLAESALTAPEAAPLTLSAPAPNPVRGSARLSLTAGSEQAVQVRVYDAAGREVAAPYDGRLAAGQSAEVVVDAAALPSGVYVVRASGERETTTQRLTVVR